MGVLFAIFQIRKLVCTILDHLNRMLIYFLSSLVLETGSIGAVDNADGSAD